jgi:hypothetical protein
MRKLASFLLMFVGSLIVTPLFIIGVTVVIIFSIGLMILKAGLDLGVK